MLSRSRKKTLNKSTQFKINPKSVCTSRDEGFDENSVSTSRVKVASTRRNICKNPRKWFQRAGIMFFFKNWPTYNFKNRAH